MPVRLREVIGYLDEILEIDRFRDYGTNGLQVEASQEVSRIVTGVSANMALFERAAEAEADLVVVHHGLFWGPGLRCIAGPTARRIASLLSQGISLAGYHLPLDAHAELGNNAGLARALELPAERELFGDVRGHALGWMSTLDETRTRAEVLDRISHAVLGGEELDFVFPYGPEKVRRIGLCTGAASDMIEEAAYAGCDLFVTGELAERAGELARELQVTLVAAGHHATEVFGPRSLAEELAKQFPELECEFINVPSPL